MDENIDTPEIAESAGLDKAFDDAYGEGEEETEVPEEPTPEVEEEPEEVPSSEEESFTSLDPNTLPEEVKPFYKSMQAAFTKKRQADSERVAKLEKQLEQLSNTNQQQERVTDLIQRVKNGDQQAYQELLSLGERSEQSEEERIRSIVQKEREEAFYKEAKNEYPKMDKRLDEDSPAHDPVLDRWVKAQLADALDAHYEQEGTSIGFDYRSKAKSLIGQWDKYIVDRNTAYMKRQSELAKKKSDEIRRKSPDTSRAPASPNKKMGLDEALEAALEQAGA